MDRSSWARVVVAFISVLAGGALGGVVLAQSTTYNYDALGRIYVVTYSDGKTARYTYDAAGNRAEVVVTGEDLTPDAFSLGDPVTDATLGAFYSSASATLSGFNSSLTASVAGGEYRIDGGAWQTTSTAVQAGQTLQVQVQAPSTQSSTQTATLSVGGVSASFSVTTRAADDTVPDPFDLGSSVAGVLGGSWVASSAPAISGINVPTPISIMGGQYRIDGGAWQTEATTVSAGQTVQVQVQAPSAGGASQTATLTVGGVSASFAVTALDWADFFLSYRGEPSGQPMPAKFVDGATVTIAGLDAGASITLSFAQDTVSAGDAGLIVVVYKNGVGVSPLSLSVADGSNYSRGDAGLTVSVTNGDTIRFRAEVFDSAIAASSGAASSRSARQLIYNQTTNTLVDTFDVSGSYEEPVFCGQEEC